MRLFIVGFLSLGAAILAGCSDESEAQRPARPLRAVAVQFHEAGETVEQTGEVHPRLETAMSFRLHGQVEFRVENGSLVKAGDVLAKLERGPSVNGVLAARADLANANAELEFAGLNAERTRNLFEKNTASKAQLQQADASRSTAEAKLAAAQAGLASAEQTLSYTELRAPYDGVISAVGSNQGQVVSAGQMVVTLISETERDAVFDIPAQLLQLKENVPTVSVSLVSDPSVTAKGAIREVTPSADPATRTYRLKIGLDASGRNMPFGAAVRGKVVLSPKQVISIPSSAITQDRSGSAVFVVERDTNTVKRRAVTAERYTGTSVLISHGLTEGELVATAGVSKLRDGEAVVIEKDAGR